MKKGLLVLLIFCIVLIAFLPSLLSYPPGRAILIRYLESSLKGNIAIEKIHLTWKGPQTFTDATFVNTDTIATLRVFESAVPFWKLPEMKRIFTIQDGTITFPTYNAQITQANAEINGHDIHIVGATPQGGSLNIQGTYVSKNDYHLNVELQQIPTIALAQFFKMDLLNLALGPTINLNGTFSQGTVLADVTSPQATASLRAIIANHILTLTSPFEATLRVSDALSLELSKRISPSILKEFSLKNPITLHIPSGSLRLPFSQIELSNAVLDLGQASISSGESLRSVLSIFKQLGKKFDIWFTPITFSMQNSDLQIQRFDALLDATIHLCAWGDIRSEKLRMNLGVPSDTLQTSFGIETLSSNYVLRIPVRGTIRQPKFETGSAIAKIATMSAAKQIPSKAGKVFGGAVNAFTQAHDEETIPQAKRPFPWEH